MNPISVHQFKDERLEYAGTIQIKHDEQLKDLDQLLEIASKLIDVPRDLLSIRENDAAAFKSHFGFNLPVPTRKLSFCTYAIESDEELFYVPDACNDSFFKHHPFVIAAQPVIFYAGVPLRDQQNLVLGTVCIIDSVPRELSKDQKESLIMISTMIKRHLQLHQEKLKLKKKQTVLKEKNKLLKDFAHVVSHDMKMPLASMIMSSDLIRLKYKDQLDEDGVTYLAGIKTAAFSMRDYIDNVLSHYESEQSVLNTNDRFDINSMLLNIEELLGMRQDYIQFIIPEENLELNCDESAVEQILVNLIGNSLKYNHKDHIRIQVTATETDKYYRISIIDNGTGIPEAKQKEVFKLFTTLNQADRSGNRGHGIGLSTVKILVDKLGGVISYKSKIDRGTTFTFTVAKQVGKS